jgi:hypothetical protein
MKLFFLGRMDKNVSIFGLPEEMLFNFVWVLKSVR